MHATVIGGGLAGPALALALAKYGIKSTIYEIRTERGDTGGSISLAPNALRALEFVGVYEEIKAVGYSYTKIKFYDEDGAEYGEGLTGSEEYPTIRILRTEIHKILLNVCQSKPDMIKIVWNAQIERISEDGDSVTAHFRDGSTAKGDFLIGADGIHSKVREHVLGESAPKPIFSGSCTISGFVPSSKITKPEGFDTPAMMLTRVGLVMALSIDSAGETTAWGVSEEIKQDKDRQGWKDYAESGAALEAARKHYTYCDYPPIRSLLDQAQEVKLWAPYYIPDLPTWHLGRVCLIGDAAHALPPNGQGSAAAFEDAVILARLIGANSTVNDETFQQFEKLRRPRIEQVKKASKQGGTVKSGNPSTLAWILKKWLIFGYFAWNRFVIRNNALFDYDVSTQQL